MAQGPLTLQILYKFEHYYYGEAYLGSYDGTRFRLAREPLRNCVFDKPDKRNEDNPVFSATVWPEPFSYEKTADELKETETFPFTEEGEVEAMEWLNSKLTSGK